MKTLRIVTFNDVYVLDNLPRLASLVARARREEPADRLLVTLAGDFLSPSILSSLDAGRGMVDCLNAIGVTHVTFGNHEDDLEVSELLSRMSELRATWLATNVRSLPSPLPTSDVVDLGGVRVGLLGIVMTDASVYRREPFGGGALPPIPAALAEARRLVEREGCAFVIPLTHQFVADDRALARAQREASVPFPVILGGHEHEAVNEDEGGTRIVKAGADAVEAFVVDVRIAPDGRVEVDARLETLSEHQEDPALRARVERHMRRVRELETATLLELGPGETLSSVGTRMRQTSLGALLCTRMRDTLGAEGCVFNGGGIRASRTYTGRFTYGDLKAEVPFDNEMVVARLPGRVVRDAVRASRAAAPSESGGFLQVDDGMRVDEGGAVTHLGGAPLVDDRDYHIALVRNFFVGLDRIEPLVRFAEEHPERVPQADSGRDVRLVLVDAFSIALWKQLGGFDAVDADHDQRVTPSEVAAALARITRHAPSRLTADLIVAALDTNQDRVVSRAEAEAADGPPEE